MKNPQKDYYNSLFKCAAEIYSKKGMIAGIETWIKEENNFLEKDKSKIEKILCNMNQNYNGSSYSTTPSYLQEKFMILNLIETYVSAAFDLASKEISMEDFDNGIREKVSDFLKIPKNLVVEIHHPFHWTFFDDSKIDSPFEYTQSAKPDQENMISLKRKNIEDKTKMIDYIFANHSSLLEGKIKNLEKINTLDTLPEQF